MEMTEELLTAAGVQHRRARFPRPPSETYAVFFDDVEVEGADPVAPPVAEALPRIYTHNVRVEVYEPKPDDKTETAIEAALDATGYPWTKADRIWVQDVQRYQVLYEITYTTKRRN